MRTLRIFVSSTFQDMHAERDALTRTVFPELRHRFRPLGIDVVEIDLRWGVTVEAAADARVLPTCLGEIDRCRPYFIGILGERYGWIDPEAQRVLERSFPHLVPYSGRSATELEIRHAVLDTPSTERSRECLFYLKDHGARECVQNEQESLRQAVRRAFPDRCRTYVSVADLVRMVVADLDQSIRHTFVTDGIPASSEMARRELLAAHTQATIERPRVLTELQTSLRPVGARVLLCGPPGVGKTTLVAQYCGLAVTGSNDSASNSYAARLRRIIESLGVRQRGTPSPRVFVCARTALGRALDWRTPVRELVDWLLPGAATGLEAKDLLESARFLVGEAAKGTPIIIVIDGLDDFAPEQGTSMSWLQALLSPRVSFLTSCRDPRIRTALERMQFRAIEVPEFSYEESERACLQYFSRYGKELAGTQMARLVGRAASMNPGLLKLKQEELRLFGNFEQLDTEIARLADMARISDVIEAIVHRVRSDRTLASSAACEEVLGCVATTRTGLSDLELREVLSALGHEVTQLDLSALLHCLAPLIAVREGSITARTSEVRGVLQRYASDKVIDALIRHFTSHPAQWRSLVELPVLLVARRSWSTLAAYLASPVVLRAMNRHAPDDLVVCARLCERESSGSLLAQIMRAIESASEPELLADTRRDAARLLVDLGYPTHALAVMGDEDVAGVPAVVDVEALQLTVAALRASNRSTEAVQAIERRIGSIDRQENLEHWVAVERLLVECLLDGRRFTQALSHARCLFEAVLPSKDQRSIYAAKHALAQALLLNGSLEESATLFRELADHADLLGNLTAQHVALGNLGIIARQRHRPREALRLHAEEEAICRSLGDLGALHVCLGNQALAWVAVGNLDRASSLLDTKLGIATQIDDRRGCRDALVAQAIVFDAMGQPAVAARLREAAEAVEG